MHRIIKPIKNERGGLTALALSILAILTIIGISATTTSTIEVQIAANEKHYKTAFYAADAGIAICRSLVGQLKAADPGYISDLLAEKSLTWNGNTVSNINAVADTTTGSRNLGEAGCDLTLENAPVSTALADDDTNEDENERVRCVSTGSFLNAAVAIEAIVEARTADYAQEGYDSENSVETVNSGGVVAATRWSGN